MGALSVVSKACQAVPPAGTQILKLTGLAGAWLLDWFATFRMATVFFLAPPSPAVLSKAGFIDEPKGANCWLGSFSHGVHGRR